MSFAQKIDLSNVIFRENQTVTFINFIKRGKDMYLNPYHFLLLKELILIDARRFHSKDDLTLDEIRIYIEGARTDYNGKNPKQFAEYVIRRIWNKDVFSFKEKELDRMCLLTKTTREFSSWMEFVTIHDNGFGRLGELLMSKPFFRLSDVELQRIKSHVAQTCSIYLEGDFVDAEKIAMSYNYKAIAEHIVNNANPKPSQIVIRSTMEFVKQNYIPIIKSAFCILLVTAMSLGKFSWKTQLVSVLAFVLIDFIVFAIRARTVIHFKAVLCFILVPLLVLAEVIVTEFLKLDIVENSDGSDFSTHRNPFDRFIEKFMGLEFEEEEDDDDADDGDIDTDNREDNYFANTHSLIYKINEFRMFPMRYIDLNFRVVARNMNDWNLILSLKNLGGNGKFFTEHVSEQDLITNHPSV